MFKSQVMKSRQHVRPSCLNTLAPEIAACCQIMQWNVPVVNCRLTCHLYCKLDTKVHRGWEMRKRNAKLPVFLWNPATPFVITRQQRQWTICLLGSPNCWFFRSELLHIEKRRCELFFVALGVAGLINVQGEGGGVAVATITRQLLLACRQFWLPSGSYTGVLSALQQHFLF